MREQTIFVAMDGTRFDSAAECRAHDREHAHLALVGLTIEQVNAALDRSNPEIADAIETVAYRISQVRKDAGEFKRRRKEHVELSSKEEALEALGALLERIIPEEDSNSAAAHPAAEPGEPALAAAGTEQRAGVGSPASFDEAAS